MPVIGKIAFGSPFVLINQRNAARRSDLLSHGGNIGEGEPSVVISGLAAARKFDRFKCPAAGTDDDGNPVPHVGGAIVEASPDVIIGGQPAARKDDVTHCHGEGFDVADLDAVPGAAGAKDKASAAKCRALWDKYQKEARSITDPAGSDHRQRNHIINGAYAKLFRDNPTFVWAGLGAYASKQVGCAMDHCLGIMADPRYQVQQPIARYMYNRLGEGNHALFLDVYPQHRFYAEHGWEKFKECAGEKVPPVGGAMLDAFEALHRYEQTGNDQYLRDHLVAMAFHEQVFILQAGIYNDRAMRFILDSNEGNLEDAFGIGGVPDVPKWKWLENVTGAMPADVVMTSECEDGTPGRKKTIPFNPNDPDRHLYDMEERMEWILDDIGGYYMPRVGTKDHNDDMDRLIKRGKAHGGKYR